MYRYLVYNLRKRGGDSADKYFKSTEVVAGVKDMRFQSLMPDVLHWLGITKIDNMVSMSDMCVFFSVALTYFNFLYRQEIQCNRRERHTHPETLRYSRPPHSARFSSGD